MYVCLILNTLALSSPLHSQEIKLGESEVVLTGGTENMSQTPYAVRNARWGSPLGVDLKVNRITVISENKPTHLFCASCWKR